MRAIELSRTPNISVSAEAPLFAPSPPDEVVTADQPPAWWLTLPKDTMRRRTQAAHDAVSMLFFVHNLPFSLINSRLWHAVVKAIKECPAYVPVHRTTLATTHLNARDEHAKAYWEGHLQSSADIGLMYCTDGWKSKRRRTYHNHILVTATGPVFLGLRDETGAGAKAVDIHDEVLSVFDKMDDCYKYMIYL